jgi:hypothetical protein
MSAPLIHPCSPGATFLSCFEQDYTNLSHVVRVVLISKTHTILSKS